MCNVTGAVWRLRAQAAERAMKALMPTVSIACDNARQGNGFYPTSDWFKMADYGLQTATEACRDIPASSGKTRPTI